MADDISEKADIQLQDDGQSLLEVLVDGRQAGRLDYFLLEPDPLDHEDGARAARVGVHTVVKLSLIHI